MGVVGTEHQAGLDVEPRAEFFAPLAQEGGRSAMTLMVRATPDPTLLARGIRRVIGSIDPDLAVLSVQTMQEIRREAVAMRHFLMTLLLAFGGTGLLLSAVGVYGVMAHVTAERRRELGIRAALGARPANLQAMVVREGVRLALVGVGIGLAGALVGVRWMTSLLFGVRPIDANTFAVASLALLVIAAIATWIPAARAGRADPVESLRTD